MRSGTFARPPLRRAYALTAAVGALALAGPALPAAAVSDPQPPPLDRTEVPDTGPLHLQQGQFEQQEGCVQGNTSGATIPEKPWSQLTLGFEQADQQELTGAGQKVAVIDTGIAPHSRLPFVDYSGSSSVPGGGADVDCDGHGTLVAGIIAAKPDEETGFQGVAPDAQLMSLRQSSSKYQNQQTNQTVGNTETMANAIWYAVDNGATVINISQASCQPVSRATDSSDWGNQQLHNAVQHAIDKDVVVVAAAGNAGECQKNAPGNPTTAVLPAFFDDQVLTVASVNQQGAPSGFTVPGPWVDVAAPGENLISVDPGGGDGLVNQIPEGDQGQMSPISGTSFAAPYVSGLVALIKEAHPELNAKDVMERVKETALHPGGNDGRNDIVGYGMINPMAALNNVVPAEYGKQPPQTGKTRLAADVIPKKNWPALLVAFGGAGCGVAAILFTAFLRNALRTVRAREGGKREAE